MNRLRACWRLASALLHVLHGLLIVLLLFPRLSEDRRQQRVQWWSRRLLAVLGLQMDVQGHGRPGPALLVSNHVSWMDIAAIHAVLPHARFVSKADVKRWPLIGRLADATGTLYIERERSRDAVRVVHHIAEALKQGQTVAVFPEGTTSDGAALLPFHANLLQAAIATGAPVQPVALRFSDAAYRVSPAAAYVGETTLLESVWAVASAEGLRVQVQLLAPLPSAHAERRALAARLREEISRGLGIRPDPVDNPVPSVVAYAAPGGVGHGASQAGAGPTAHR